MPILRPGGKVATLVFIAGTVLILIVGAWFFRPLVVDLKELLAEESLLEERRLELECRLPDAEEIERRHAENSEKLANLSARIADEDNLSDLFSRFDRTLSSSDITVSRVKITFSEGKGAGSFDSYDVELSATAALEMTLLELLKEIEDFPYLSLVRNISLRGGQPPDGVERGEGAFSDSRPRLQVLFSLVASLPEQSSSTEADDDEHGP
jgi:hypothetical protein